MNPARWKIHFQQNFWILAHKIRNLVNPCPNLDHRYLFPQWKVLWRFCSSQSGRTNTWGSIRIWGRARTFFTFSGNSSPIGTTIDWRITDSQRSNYSVARSRSRPTRSRVATKWRSTRLYSTSTTASSTRPTKSWRIKKIRVNTDCPKRICPPIWRKVILIVLILKRDNQYGLCICSRSDSCFMPMQPPKLIQTPWPWSKPCRNPTLISSLKPWLRKSMTTSNKNRGT